MMLELTDTERKVIRNLVEPHHRTTLKKVGYAVKRANAGDNIITQDVMQKWADYAKILENLLKKI